MPVTRNAGRAAHQEPRVRRCAPIPQSLPRPSPPPPVAARLPDVNPLNLSFAPQPGGGRRPSIPKLQSRKGPIAAFWIDNYPFL